MIRRERRFLNESENPSFSSTLLDQIYRSIDQGDSDMKFYTGKTGEKQSRVCVTEEHLSAKSSVSRDWKANNVVGTQGRQRMMQKERNFHLGRQVHVHDQDALFFSSTSSSSDSSSGLLSSSSPDIETLYGVRSRGSCFAPARPKPVRTTVPEKKHVERQRHIVSDDDDGLIKSKSRALKIYNNLKKVKQPISPGGKLTSFLNSLFTTGNSNNTKKTKPCFEDANALRKTESGQASTCSSASSFARSCLSKNSPSTREKLRNNGVKRTVRFYPVSVIVDEDSRPCGHKSLYETEDARLMAMSVPTAWKIGTKKNVEEVKDKKNRAMEEAAREILEEYHHIQRKSDLVLRRNLEDEIEDDDEDDAASCSSSDLFELDHLHEELPVYETTRVGTNRAIANRFIM
ncbi:protein BIG GRAIN 1-like B [Lotus japonicus]|uniref:protein BIG GRAIN 1-like B n=1 Tax=Lotus japonicus TaxID=34305 RepID=UPI002584E013|nr:protein BIG GRAIN 1-like B [Lotus japonicus]